MKLLLQVCLFLVLGGLAAWVIEKDSGYAFLAWGNWSVELSLAMLVLLATVAAGLLYYLLHFLFGLIHLPGGLSTWRRRLRQRRARHALTQGLVELAEGHWQQAEKLLTRHAVFSDTPLINYLSAAQAAQRQGSDDRRDAYIRLAHQHMPTADVAVGLTQAELQIAHQQFEQALATLKHLRELAPRHAYVLRLLASLYQQVGDWEQLRKLLPELKKDRTRNPEQLDELEVQVYRALLQEAARAMEVSRLDSVWQKIPRSLHQEPRILGDYTRLLHERQRDEEAEQLLRAALKKHWHDDLVALYGLLDLTEPSAALTRAEGWLAVHELDPVLLLTLGRLSLRAGLWGKARSYLEAAIAHGAGLAARRELGRLLDALGEQEAAARVYREAVLEQPGTAPVVLPAHIRQANMNLNNGDDPLLPDLPDAVAES
ncbi:heme biosynthesis HemY N-terminal domain-containing protein [Thiolapillus sp.]|uniref:heme biosynthesis HemY N-terminal domain-containing protein n=1 Tax=Thiolapillus sp. TaxID=2017437 RepID=UPI0025E7E348|nr:heme biosynthesis HemY N-terminal domain-containing protein [Thiolapillus sp.]